MRATRVLAVTLLIAAATSTARAGSPAPGPASAWLPHTRCAAFPATDVWHADISRLPRNARSAQWLSHMQAASRLLHPDFGPSYGEQPVPYGIPITVVGKGHPTVPVSFDYADESDRVRYPLGGDTRIEGGTGAGGDRHAIVVDAATCTLFETFDTHPGSPAWTAGSGAVWKLTGSKLRPRGWTSADAAGLPILPGLLRLDEVRRGRVDHAIRFTTDVTDRSFVWPARHQAGSVSDSSFPPMGARFRLKASFSIGHYSRDTRVVLTAMQHYGLMLADNGTPWFFQGTSEDGWPSALLDELKTIPASAFEAVDESSLQASKDSGTVRPR